MRKTNEKLLEAWLNLTSSICNERLVTSMSFNEAFVCGLLYKQKKLQPNEPYLAVKYLISQTQILKSQMNKVLNDLENRGIVERLRFKKDRRYVYVTLCDIGVIEYEKEHEKILHIVNEVIEQVGESDALIAIDIFSRVAKAVQNTTAVKQLKK